MSSSDKSGVSKLPLNNQLNLGKLEGKTRKQIVLDGLEKSYKMREEWSVFIRWMIFLLIFIQIVCVVAIGLGWLSYKGNETLTWIFFSETFAQVVGLAWLVVKFLFNSFEK